MKRVVAQMLAQGQVQRGFLGMQLAQGFEPNEAAPPRPRKGARRPRGKGLPDTPASSAGLRPNDVILQIESVAVRNENHLINLISNLPIGQRIRMQVWRDHAPPRRSSRRRRLGQGPDAVQGGLSGTIQNATNRTAPSDSIVEFPLAA
ncbi:MAG: PDZ domain-containing protein [Gemmataceae bacterium]